MKLNKLTNLEQDSILNDYNDAIKSIEKFLNILSNTAELDKLMLDELDDIKSEYGEIDYQLSLKMKGF